MVTKEDIDSRFRYNLIRLRLAAGLSQTDLARWSGVPHVAQLENGTVMAGKSVMIKLAGALDVDFSEFYRPTGAENRGEEALLKKFRRCTPQGQQAILKLINVLVEYEKSAKIF